MIPCTCVLAGGIGISNLSSHSCSLVTSPFAKFTIAAVTIRSDAGSTPVVSVSKAMKPGSSHQGAGVFVSGVTPLSNTSEGWIEARTGLREVAVTNAFGVHALVWTGGWEPEQAEFAISRTAAAGYDLIEIPALDPSAIDVDDTRARLEAHGLSATMTLGLTFATDINSEDTTLVAAGRETLMSALQVARGVGATHLGGVIFSAMDKYPGGGDGRRPREQRRSHQGTRSRVSTLRHHDHPGVRQPVRKQPAEHRAADT